MDLLSQYESLSEDDEISFRNPSGGEERCSPEEVLKDNQPHSVYLITYSQADLRLVPTRQAFTDLVLEAVHENNATEVQWVCAKEKHRSG